MTTFLLIHGGGGPFTVAGIGAHLAGLGEVVAPVLPGWNGTPRDGLESVRDYGRHFAELLERDGLDDVVVVGSSVGGWIAAELALVSSRVGRLILVDAGGIVVDGQPIANIAGLAPQEIAKISFHDPSKFAPPPATPEAIAAARANQATLARIAGGVDGADPTLLGRLASVAAPTLVIWGESDGVYTPESGRAYAAAIPGASFVLIPAAGHLPHLENPDAVFAAIDAFVG